MLNLVELDHFLISAIDHLADIHIGKGIVRGVPIADIWRTSLTTTVEASLSSSLRGGSGDCLGRTLTKF